MSSQDLQARLRRLGIKAGRRSLSGAPTGPARSTAAELPPGIEIETEAGKAYCIESRYPSTHIHGNVPLGDLRGIELDLAADIAREGPLARFALGELLFLDTETTGLAGGAGTLVFLIGVGRFDQEGFRLRQYFLRHPEEEAATLEALAQDLEASQAFVTFNGKAFDIPLLEMRYVVGLRRRWRLTGWPHLDLLHPARRLWQRSLPDCTLGTLERRILDVARSEKDVPGAMIPALYLDYLRSGNTAEMERVIYHNAVDVLSLVGLTTQILSRYRDEAQERLNPGEALAVAGWHELAGRAKQADSIYRSALEYPDSGARLDLLRRFTAHLKRRGRYEQALEGWRSWHELSPDDPSPCLELAKVFEWRLPDLERAQRWTLRARRAVEQWPPDWRREAALGEIAHRLARLERKLSKDR